MRRGRPDVRARKGENGAVGDDKSRRCRFAASCTVVYRAVLYGVS